MQEQVNSICRRGASASWTIDSEPIVARGIIVNYKYLGCLIDPTLSLNQIGWMRS